MLLHVLLFIIIIGLISKIFGNRIFFSIAKIKFVQIIFMKFMQIKNRYTLYKNNKLQVLEYMFVFIKTECNIYRFNFKNNDKIYPINIVSLSILNSSDTDIITKRLQDNWEWRNVFVHVGISDENDNELYDITEQIRSFYYHFDDNYFSNFSNQECKFKYFVEYIKDHENIKLNNCNLIAYMNDNDFTQRKFRIDDILEYTYKDLFYTN